MLGKKERLVFLRGGGGVDTPMHTMGACAAIHTRYVMYMCNHVGSIILLPLMMGMSFVLVTL